MFHLRWYLAVLLVHTSLPMVHTSSVGNFTEAINYCEQTGQLMPEILNVADFEFWKATAIMGNVWVNARRNQTPDYNQDLCNRCQQSDTNCDVCEDALSTFTWQSSGKSFLETDLFLSNASGNVHTFLNQYFNRGEPSFMGSGLQERCLEMRADGFNDFPCNRSSRINCVGSIILQNTFSVVGINYTAPGDVVFLKNTVIVVDSNSSISIGGCPTFNENVMVDTNAVQKINSLPLFNFRDDCVVDKQNVSLIDNINSCFQPNTRGKLVILFSSSCSSQPDGGSDFPIIPVAVIITVLVILLVITILVLTLIIPSWRERIYPYNWAKR